MPNLTSALPKKTGDINKDYDRLYNWAVSLVDELKAILCNLDSGNVSEAAKVQARNIDCSKAKIKDAQIRSLTADKLTAGTIDTGEITISNSNGKHEMNMQDDSLIFSEDGKIRIAMGRLNNSDSYVFIVQNKDASQGLYMDDGKRLYFTGEIQGGKLSSDTIIDVGTDVKIGRSIILKDTYEGGTGADAAAEIFVDFGTMYIKANNNRQINIQTDGRVIINNVDVLQEIKDIKSKL